MKFSASSTKSVKISDSLLVHEYCLGFKDLPIDGAIAEINGSFGPKINRIFTELFFILSGTLTIEMEGSFYELNAHDMFIIPPDKKHTLTGNNCKLFISCSPQFNPDNIELIESQSKKKCSPLFIQVFSIEAFL